MGHRLSRIATRTGDDGSTGLGDGTRTRKDAARVRAMGDVDELNSSIGLLLTEELPAAVAADLTDIQHDLFDLGAELATPNDPEKPLDPAMRLVILPSQVARLEKEIDENRPQVGVAAETAAGAGTAAVWQSQTTMPPTVWRWPKWIWACVTALSRPS